MGLSCPRLLFCHHLCTHERQHILDTTAYQEIATHAIQAIPNQPHAQHVILDEWIIMPNHVHTIIIFTDYPAQMKDISESSTLLAGSLGVIVSRYKAAVTSRINHLRRTPRTAVWQRGYYEHIIRNEREWRAVQEYIRQNPILLGGR